MGFLDGLTKNAPGIGAGLSILSGVTNMIGQRAATNREHAWQEQMYGWQRRDALADWNMQNEYNSPAAQMQRLKAAGLNPNLVYGNGADAQMGGPVRSSSPGSGGGQAPRLDLSGVAPSLMQAYDLKLRSAQTDNVAAATAATLQDKLLKQAQTWATIQAAGKTGLESDEIKVRLSRAQELLDSQVDAIKLGNVQKAAETQVLLSRNEREAIANTQSVAESVARILRMRIENAKTAMETAKTADERKEISKRIDEMSARISNINADTDIKKADADLKKQGIQPHDALWQRKVAEALNNGLVPHRQWINPFMPHFVP